MNTDQCLLLGTLRHQAGIGTHTAIVTVTDTGHRHKHRVNNSGSPTMDYSSTAKINYIH